MSNETKAPAMDQLAAGFIKLRDKMAAINKAAEEEVAKLKVMQDKISTAMLKVLNDTGAKSIATECGTVYKEELLMPRAADWDVFYKWIGENDAYEFLEKRITKKAIAEYLGEHEEPPPGVAVQREFVARVRRK